MLTDFPIQSILDRLVGRIVDVMPVTSAGVTLITAGADPRYVSASDAAALRFEKLQTRLGEGPWLEAWQTGTAEAVAAAYLLNAQARADLQQASDRSLHSAMHDPLTRLPNRTLFTSRLEHAIDRRRRSGGTMAVCFLDLDRFKEVNDSCGHAVGDELLVAFAGRVAKELRLGDTLARMYGDEFLLLLEELTDCSEADAIAQRISDAVSDLFMVGGAEVVISASIGIACSDRHPRRPKSSGMPTPPCTCPSAAVVAGGVRPFDWRRCSTLARGTWPMSCRGQPAGENYAWSAAQWRRSWTAGCSGSRR